MTINFTHPENLLFLFLVPGIIFVHFFSIHLRKQKSLRFANFEAIARIKGIDIYSKNLVLLGLSCIVIFLIVFSISGLTIQREIQTSGFSFVLALDSSRSMEANDFRPNRMEAAKRTAKAFVDAVPAGTGIGVISFSGNALIEERVTDDKSLIKGAINDINITFVGGTDIYEALITASNLLDKEENKAIILLSDGQMNVGALEEAIGYAVKNEVTVHTIAIGTLEGGQTSYGLSKLDEDSLKAISFNTGGRFFQAGNLGQLIGSFEDILDVKKKNVAFSLSNYLLIAALLVFILEYTLFNIHYKMFP